MALITDYDSLVSEVKAYMARSDSTFGARFPMFVALAEDRIYSGVGQPGDPLYSAPLRCRVMETTTTITTSSGQATMPEDILAVRKLARDADQIGMTYASPDRFAAYLAQAPSGYPSQYTTEALTLKVAPSWDGDLTLLYYKRLTAISADNKTGDLLTAHPLVYFNAVMFEAFSFLQDIDLAGAWLARLRSTIDGVNIVETGLRTPGRLRSIAQAIG